MVLSHLLFNGKNSIFLTLYYRLSTKAFESVYKNLSVPQNATFRDLRRSNIKFNMKLKKSFIKMFMLLKLVHGDI